MGPTCSGLATWKLDAILSHPAGLVQRSGRVLNLRFGLRRGLSRLVLLNLRSAADAGLGVG